MRRTVVTTPEAEADALFIDSWWQVNRPAAPGLFLEELADVFSLLADMAGVGQRWPHPEVPDVRRLILRATRHHVYYVTTDDLVIVLAVWGAPRRGSPTLRRPPAR